MGFSYTLHNSYNWSEVDLLSYDAIINQVEIVAYFVLVLVMDPNVGLNCPPYSLTCILVSKGHDDMAKVLLDHGSNPAMLESKKLFKMKREYQTYFRAGAHPQS